MIYRVISKDEFKKFINNLIEDNQTFGPVAVDMDMNGKPAYQFKPIHSYGEIDPQYTITYSSIKNFFLPYREELSRYKFSDNNWEQNIEYRVNPRVITGVRACDINALNILDNVFLRGSYPSPYYTARRKNTFIIGMDHEPLDDCFCNSMDQQSVRNGFNLFCTDIGDRYYLHINSSKAFSFLKNFKIKEPVKDDNIQYINRRKQLNRLFKTSVDIGSLPSYLDIEFESPIWKKWGDKCLSCGTCAMVCPTCYCYGIEETISLNLKESRKERVQHSCNLVNFAMVAGGHNFRPKKGDRLKYRYYHQYRGFAENGNEPLCVGCNRCGRACLADINPEDVINDLRMEKLDEI